jgi:two-component system sensor histidine kinase VicK
LEFRIRPKHESEKWINATAYVILQNGQRQWIAGFADDITHYKESAITANSYSIHKNAMLEMLAHDLGGPLGAVQQIAARLERRSREAGQDKIADEVKIIHQTVSQSIHLIHELLEQEYLESSQVGVKFSRVELIEQIHAMLEGYRRMDPEQHKHFTLQSSDPHIFAEVDQTKFMQAIGNLVSNALKFTHPGGHITIHVQELLQRVRISVTDDGIGIPEHLQPHLFERFTPARRPGLLGEATTGLGLSIVRRTVELHGGKIWVESKENEGSTFTIDIPSQQ